MNGHEHRQCGGHGGLVVLSFLVGGIVGAGLTFFLTPYSGAEARERVRDMGEDIKEKATDYRDLVRDEVKHAISKSRDFVVGQKEMLASAVEAGRAAYEEEKARHEARDHKTGDA